MSRGILIFLSIALMFGAAGYGADIDLTGWASWVDPQEDDHGAIIFDRELGFGAGLNVFWGTRFSTELAIYTVQPDVLISRGLDTAAILLNTGGLNVVPVTVSAQYHFGRNRRWDPYVGLGVAYVLFDDVDNAADLDDVDLNQIDLGEDYGFTVGGGVNWNFSDRFGLNVDAKYVPVDSEARLIPTEGEPLSGEANFSPLILSAGLTLKF